jgi:hypothetical protein
VYKEHNCTQSHLHLVHVVHLDRRVADVLIGRRTAGHDGTGVIYVRHRHFVAAPCLFDQKLRLPPDSDPMTFDS